MKKLMSAMLAASLLCSSVLSQEVLAVELPDPSELGKLVSEAAAGIADAAGTAGKTIADAAEAAKEAIADAAGQMGEAAGETADSVKQKLSDAGVKIKTSAEELGDATAGKASELAEKAGKTADDAIEIVSGAGDFVVDKAGHVVDLAAAAADHVSSGAAEALKVLRKYGTLLMSLAEEAASGLDLSKEGSWNKAEAAVDAAVSKAFEQGLIDRKKVSEKTMRVVTSIVFRALMYGYQYKTEQITLGKYVSLMSEILIREGLPAGVGYLVSILPISNIPHAETIAKEAVYYLISKAYADASGDEIEAEEESLLEDGMKAEMTTDPMLTEGGGNAPQKAEELPEEIREAFEEASKDLFGWYRTTVP